MKIIILEPVIKDPSDDCIYSRVSEGERNRLIIAHMDLTTKIAAGFRSKDIPFEELVAEARKCLVVAAGYPHREGEFPEYASACIRNGLSKFIREWEGLVGSDQEDWERYFYEWGVWGFAAPYESWETLAASPEDIVDRFEELRGRQTALMSALISLDDRSRSMVTKRFFREPNMSLQDIALDHKLSYANTVQIIHRALNKLSDVVKNIERKPRLIA